MGIGSRGDRSPPCRVEGPWVLCNLAHFCLTVRLYLCMSGLVCVRVSVDQ